MCTTHDCLQTFLTVKYFLSYLHFVFFCVFIFYLFYLMYDIFKLSNGRCEKLTKRLTLQQQCCRAFVGWAPATNHPIQLRFRTLFISSTFIWQENCFNSNYFHIHEVGEPEPT